MSFGTQVLTSDIQYPDWVTLSIHVELTKCPELKTLQVTTQGSQPILGHTSWYCIKFIRKTHTSLVLVLNLFFKFHTSLILVSNLFYDFYISPVLVLGFKNQYQACIYLILRFVPPWYETGYKSFFNFHIKQVLVLNLFKKIQTWLVMVRGVVASRPCNADMFCKYKNQYQSIYQGAINIPTSLVWTLESIMPL